MRRYEQNTLEHYYRRSRGERGPRGQKGRESKIFVHISANDGQK